MSVTIMPKPRLKTRLRTEIRERQQAEAALRDSEERYRIISQAISDYAFAFHFASDGALIVDWLTNSFTKITGYPVSEVLGNPRALTTYIHPEDQERVMTTLRTLPPGDPFRRRLEILESETQRCTRLVRDLVDFVRPAPTLRVWTDLQKLISTSLTLVATPLRQQRIQAAVEVQANLPRLYVDAQQLQQVLLNLFFNAIEAMPHGGRLSVQAALIPALTETNGTQDPDMVIRVTDTGTGIAVEDQAKIFRPFFTTKTKGGMGLGLSICQSIIQAHGGRMTVDSQAGQGTTLSIMLPLPPLSRTEAVDA